MKKAAIHKRIVAAVRFCLYLFSCVGKGFWAFVVYQTDLFPENLKILMCEDHPLNAKIVIKLLEQKNAVVTWVDNGKAGVDRFVESEPGYYDIILMDIRMPVMTGLEAAKAIRGLNRADAETIPITAMTANVYDTDVKASVDAGIDRHLAKPIEPQLLYDTICEYVKERE